MAIKEVHTINGSHAVYIQYHNTDIDPPEPVDIKPAKLADDIFRFTDGRYGWRGLTAKESDIITVSFERI